MQTKLHVFKRDLRCTCLTDYWFLQTECHPGTYGPNCLQTCSGNCLNNSTCNRTNGTCDMGCGSGYTGDLCDKGLTGSIVFLRKHWHLKKIQ